MIRHATDDDVQRIVPIFEPSLAWLTHPYVHPDECWIFQQNERARRFQEAHGAIAVEFTDGSNNEEKTPDVRYRWTSGS